MNINRDMNRFPKVVFKWEMNIIIRGEDVHISKTVCTIILRFQIALSLFLILSLSHSLSLFLSHSLSLSLSHILALCHVLPLCLFSLCVSFFALMSAYTKTGMLTQTIHTQSYQQKRLRTYKQTNKLTYTQKT